MTNILITRIPMPDFNSSGPDWIIRNRMARSIADIPGIEYAFLDETYPETIGIVWRSVNDVPPNTQTEEVPSTFLETVRAWSYEEIFGRPMPPARQLPIQQNENNANYNTNEYNISNFTNIRNIPKNSKNAITYNTIVNKNKMVNFHGNYARTSPRYYKKTTFNSIITNEDGYKRDPFTRNIIQKNNIRGYTARVVGGRHKTLNAKKRKTRRHIRH